MPVVPDRHPVGRHEDRRPRARRTKTDKNALHDSPFKTGTRYAKISPHAGRHTARTSVCGRNLKAFETSPHAAAAACGLGEKVR